MKVQAFECRSLQRRFYIQAEYNVHKGIILILGFTPISQKQFTHIPASAQFIISFKNSFSIDEASTASDMVTHDVQKTA